MKHLFLVCILYLCCLGGLHSQEVINVWSNAKPPITYDGDNRTELYVYSPPINKDTTRLPAVLIFSGGGYGKVNDNKEGFPFARWLQSNGFVAIVLKYRLPHGIAEIPFDDAKKAIEIIKNNAERWNINLNKFGIAGFSAGGNLASVFTNRLANDSQEIHPAFSILFYPVTSLLQSTKGTTRQNLIGEHPSEAEMHKYSAQFLVTTQTPTTIIFVSDDDNLVSPTKNSVVYYDALKANEIKVAMYIFPVGRHGWGMSQTFKYHYQMLDLLDMWLQNTVLQ